MAKRIMNTKDHLQRDSSWWRRAEFELESAYAWNYPGGNSSFTEPAAFCALALTQMGNADSARIPLKWLSMIQSKEGSLGISQKMATPRWPTALAMLAWSEFGHRFESHEFSSQLKRAKEWSFSIAGTQIPSAKKELIGHNTMLIGWPWVEGTHSWIEPTAFFILAFKSMGLSGHARVREAVRLLEDRQLPNGGCNFGNTFILGQQLLPHPQPSGIAMMALAGEADAKSLHGQGLQTATPVDRTLAYLNRVESTELAPSSLAFVSMGLQAHVPLSDVQKEKLRTTFVSKVFRQANIYHIALFVLALAAEHSIFMGSSDQVQAVS